MTRRSTRPTMTWLRRLACTVALFVVIPTAAFAADNTATGDVAGVSGDLSDSNTFSLTTTLLALTKTAFLSDGTPLASGATLPAGTRVKFMVYVDNTTAVAVNDVNVQDALVATFGYQTGTIKVGTAATGSTEAAIYAAVDGTLPLDDGVDGTDVAGIAGTTISAGSGTGNVQVDVPASTVWALLFEVTMQ